MASDQYFSLSVPKKIEDMGDFVAVLKLLLDQLFQTSHFHVLTRTTAPGVNDGKPGDIYSITISGTDYLYVKNATGTWKKVALS